jgi:hypothetical protein
MNLLVLNSKTLYCSGIVFANDIENTTFIIFLWKVNKRENIFTATESRFLPKAPVWLQTLGLPLNSHSVISHHMRLHSLAYISFYHSRHRQNVFSVSFCISRTAHSCSQAWRTLTVTLWANGHMRRHNYFVRFQVLTAASMMFRAVFWVVLPCK